MCYLEYNPLLDKLSIPHYIQRCMCVLGEFLSTYTTRYGYVYVGCIEQRIQLEIRRLR